MTEEAVYCADGDANDLLVMHRFDSSDEAHAFMENPELREAMTDAGVNVGSLRVEFYEQA